MAKTGVFFATALASGIFTFFSASLLSAHPLAAGVR
jgi:hypothetical protein